MSRIERGSVSGGDAHAAAMCDRDVPRRCAPCRGAGAVSTGTGACRSTSRERFEPDADAFRPTSPANARIDPPRSRPQRPAAQRLDRRRVDRLAPAVPAVAVEGRGGCASLSRIITSSWWSSSSPSSDWMASDFAASSRIGGQRASRDHRREQRQRLVGLDPEQRPAGRMVRQHVGRSLHPSGRSSVAYCRATRGRRARAA